MAGPAIAGFAADLLGGGLSSLISAGANAINQKVEFGYNQKLQASSFAHDKEMLQAQVAATKQLQREMIAIKQGVLQEAGFSATDAARGAINAPMTKTLDWNGTRYWAPGAMRTTSYSGQFVHHGTPPLRLQRPKQPDTNVTPRDTRLPITDVKNGMVHAPVQRGGAITPMRPGDTWSMVSGSWGQDQASNSTRSTRLSSSSASTRSLESTLSRSAARTQEWVEQQRERSMRPFMEGALQTTFVTPPSSRASSSASTASTVSKDILDSWTPAFNLQRQPYFAHLRRRGESSA